MSDTTEIQQQVEDTSLSDNQTTSLTDETVIDKTSDNHEQHDGFDIVLNNDEKKNRKVSQMKMQSMLLVVLQEKGNTK
ncbi:Bacteriophage, scaffolding protein [Arsenophonus nasoniae]|uniref:Bacteriophage, scaffolding protein n=1 Tax=Arsenophonus nasoniae TaxID=638 RepID=A0A4P7KY85_9GAMM|nr:Bacteriophage, scaffolding protein [Arsenophonus nasoniae]